MADRAARIVAPRAVPAREGIDPAAIPFDALFAGGEPVILKGVARDWPLVRAGLESSHAAMELLRRFDIGRPVTAFTAAPEIRGRFHYNADVTGMNFAGTRVPLGDMLDRIAAHLDDPAPPGFYIGSTDLGIFFPGLADENRLALTHPVFAAHPPLESIWIGNRTIASAHYDMSHNMAVCVAGRRRFTLFPPDQIANLYPGPLEPTPGGQVVSMVDFDAPDLDRYPRFAEAMAHARVAELEPGDLLYYPALWWHHVEALDAFNILVNYWWNPSPAFLDNPQNSLLHAMLSLRDRPADEKAAWRALFDYYVFGPADAPAAHLPPHAQGPLAPLDANAARRLRGALLNRLNR